MLDHPHVFLGAVVVLLCPWRLRSLLSETKPWAKNATRPSKPNDGEGQARLTAEERREAARKHFLGFLVDVPVIVMAACAFLCAWRAPLLWRELRLGRSGVPAKNR